MTETIENTLLEESANYIVILDVKGEAYKVINKNTSIAEVIVPQLPAAIDAMIHLENALGTSKEKLEAMKRAAAFKTAQPSGGNVVTIN